MPSFYGSVTDYQNSPLGQQQKPYWQSLTAGVLDQHYAAASDAVDRYCKRRLAAPPTTTVGTGGGTVGASSIAVASATNIHPLDVLLFPSTGEVVEVQGADITSWAAGAPYPGTVYLNAPLGNTYAAGAAVTVYRQDRFEMRGKNASPMDDVSVMSQAGQLARMHAPPGAGAQSGRRIVLREYPVLSIYQAFESLPWTGTETQAQLSNIYVDREEGWYRLPIGFYNPMSTMWRTQYLAGYRVIPQDIQDAVHLFLANMIARSMNMMGAVEVRSEGQMARLTRQTASVGRAEPQPLFVEEAMRTLDQGGYRRTTI